MTDLAALASKSKRQKVSPLVAALIAVVFPFLLAFIEPDVGWHEAGATVRQKFSYELCSFLCKPHYVVVVGTNPGFSILVETDSEVYHHVTVGQQVRYRYLKALGLTWQRELMALS